MADDKSRRKNNYMQRLNEYSALTLFVSVVVRLTLIFSRLQMPSFQKIVFSPSILSFTAERLLLCNERCVSAPFLRPEFDSDDDDDDHVP